MADMPFFKGIDINKMPNVLRCLDGCVKKFEKGQIIYDYHQTINYAGIVLEGEIGIVMLNSSGSLHNVRICHQGELFGEAYACITSEPSVVQIIAKKKCKILFLKFEKLFNETSVKCPYAARVSVNLLRDMARKNIFQNKKVEILAQKHIREKLVLFLELCKIETNKILVPYDRQNLANYLGVERSALSRELGRMKKEGLIDYNKNEITVISDTLL